LHHHPLKLAGRFFGIVNPNAGKQLLELTETTGKETAHVKGIIMERRIRDRDNMIAKRGEYECRKDDRTCIYIALHTNHLDGQIGSATFNDRACIRRMS
jgi:hypothetical protein